MDWAEFGKAILAVFQSGNLRLIVFVSFALGVLFGGGAVRWYDAHFRYLRLENKLNDTQETLIRAQAERETAQKERDQLREKYQRYQALEYAELAQEPDASPYVSLDDD